MRIEADGEVDLCSRDQGFEINLYVTIDSRTMTAIWMGIGTVKSERDKMELQSARKAVETIQIWLRLSPFENKETCRLRTLISDSILGHPSCLL